MAALQTSGIVQLQQLPHLEFKSETERPGNIWEKASFKMAYVSSTTHTHGSIVERFSSVMKNLMASMERRRIYNQTIRELRSLSTRELADLGLNREMITRVALEAAYGK